MNKSRKSRTSRILNSIKTWDNLYIDLFLRLTNLTKDQLTRDFFDSLHDSQFDEYFRKQHGLKTIINRKQVKTSRTSFFIRELISDLKFNKEGVTTIQTRSQAEARFIRLFEQYRVLWSYESVHLIKKDKSGVYTPDFIVEFNGNRYIIECKGTFYNCDKEYYIENCIGALIEYAMKEKLIPCLTFEQYPKTLNFLEKDRLC